MRLADIVERLVIDRRKLSRYALNPDSPRGQHKAVLFERLLGFTRENCAGLIQQLEERCLTAQVTFHSEDGFGRRFTADVVIEGTSGQQATVRTGWVVPTEGREAHLVTLYVRKG